MLNKRISSLVVALLLAVCFTFSVFAVDATSNVSYTGKELQVKNGDVSFSDLLPGTSRSQDIVLTNDSDKPADFYMDMRVLKALEDNAASGTVYTIGLSVSTDAGTTYIYGKDASGNAVGGTGSKGMYELNSDLDTLTASSAGSWLNVARLEPGKKATVHFSIAIDGTATSNQYQSQLGQIEFAFRVADVENVVVTVQKTETKVETVVRTMVRSVQTGDNAPILMLSLVMLVGVVLLVVLVLKRKKHSAQKQ